MDKQTKALSLVAAYPFGLGKGLGREIDEIRTMAIDGFRNKSSVRRAHVAHLFRERGLLDEFIINHWIFGRSAGGQKKLRYYERLRLKHLELLGGADEDDGAETDDDEASTVDGQEEEQAQRFAPEWKGGTPATVAIGKMAVESPMHRRRPIMASINRRSALALGLGATSLLVLRTPRGEGAVGEEKKLAKGVKQRILGEGPSLIPGYSKVSMRDIVFEPGATVPPSEMKNAMVCHIPQGELKVTQNGKEFVAKKYHVWTCAKGTTTEAATNAGSTVAIMRITDLLET